MNHHKGKFLCQNKVLATEWLTLKTFLSDSNTHLAPLAVKQMLKTQVDPSLEPIWFPSAVASDKIRVSFLISVHWLASAGASHKANGHEHNVGTTPAVLRRNTVALSLIETSLRPISTDGCHMYANKEQSESRSPISTTCLPHTATPNSPYSIHTRTHTCYLPSKSLWRDSSVLSILQLYINRREDISMTLIIILFFFQEQTWGGVPGRGGWQTDTSRAARKRAHQLFFVFVEDVLRVCLRGWGVKCGFCGQGASRPRELAYCPFLLCVCVCEWVCVGRECMQLYLLIGLQVWDNWRSFSAPPVALMLPLHSCQPIFLLHDNLKETKP